MFAQHSVQAIRRDLVSTRSMELTLERLLTGQIPPDQTAPAQPPPNAASDKLFASPTTALAAGKTFDEVEEEVMASDASSVPAATWRDDADDRSRLYQQRKDALIAQMRRYVI